MSGDSIDLGPVSHQVPVTETYRLAAGEGAELARSLIASGIGAVDTANGLITAGLAVWAANGGSVAAADDLLAKWAEARDDADR